MKKLIVLLLCVILLAGCDAPVTVAERSDQLVNDYNALLVEQDNQLLEIERLKKANEKCTSLRDEHNALINDYSNLQTQYVVLEAYSKIIRDQYTALLEQFSTRYVDSGERYTEIYKQNMILTETYRELNEQIDAVHKGNVPLLSDNLTETEYNAFYKGWNLWWGEFNEE